MMDIKNFIKEIIPVICGILVALAVNNWNEDRKDSKYLDHIYRSIDNELEESKNEIVQSIPKQQTLIDTIAKYIPDESMSIFDIIQRGNGIQKPTIKINSWKAISNTKIELIDFKKLSDLSEIDESKKNLEFKSEKLVDWLIDNLKSTDQEKKEVFLLLCQEIISTTNHAYKEIDEYLK